MKELGLGADSKGIQELIPETAEPHDMLESCRW